MNQPEKDDRVRVRDQLCKGPEAEPRTEQARAILPVFTFAEGYHLVPPESWEDWPNETRRVLPVYASGFSVLFCFVF